MNPKAIRIYLIIMGIIGLEHVLTNCQFLVREFVQNDFRYSSPKSSHFQLLLRQLIKEKNICINKCSIHQFWVCFFDDSLSAFL
jgi:hypothetical protein